MIIGLSINEKEPSIYKISFKNIVRENPYAQCAHTVAKRCAEIKFGLEKVHI